MAEDGEIDVTGPGGVGVRAKGYRLMDIVCLSAAFGVGYLCLMVYNHTADAKDDKQAIVQALKDNTNAQKEMVNAQREANCLARLTPQERSRAQNVEFCRQLGAGR